VLTCVGVLKGSFLFMADLVRAIGGDVRCEFLGVSSYHGGTRSTGVVQITQDLRYPIEGQDVLIIEDIIDTGLTMDYLLRMLRTRGPRTLTVATLLDKPSRREVDLSADHTGFSIPDEFVVGYGLDLGELYRNLPYVAVYTP
jgi:hypoxanthine phosphoribosyltransferase